MKPKIPRFRAPQKRSWPAISPALLAIALLIAGSAGLYLFRLQGLINASSGELQTIANLSTVSGLGHNLLLLPYKALATGLLQLPLDDLLMVRAASVSLALLSVGLFFVLATRWYGLIGGTATSLLFATSGWLLHTGRYGAGYMALTLMILGLLGFTAWLSSTDKSGRALMAMAACYGLSLYIPGGIWFVAASVFVARRSILEHLRQAGSSQHLLAGSIGAVTIAGLAFTFVQDNTLIRQWLALPSQLPGLVDLAKQAALGISAFVIRGPGTPEVWLAHTPILDTASIIMLLLGVIFYAQHRRNPRTLLLALFTSISMVIIMLNGAPALGLLVPIVYLVVGGGLAWFLYQWKKTFPHNPFARATALIMVGVLGLCVVAFHTQRYFVAWRLSPATAQTYQQAAPSTISVPYLIQ